MTVVVQDIGTFLSISRPFIPPGLTQPSRNAYSGAEVAGSVHHQHRVGEESVRNEFAVVALLVIAVTTKAMLDVNHGKAGSRASRLSPSTRSLRGCFLVSNPILRTQFRDKSLLGWLIVGKGTHVITLLLENTLESRDKPTVEAEKLASVMDEVGVVNMHEVKIISLIPCVPYGVQLEGGELGLFLKQDWASEKSFSSVLVRMLHDFFWFLVQVVYIVGDQGRSVDDSAEACDGGFESRGHIYLLKRHSISE